jgi:hypothetical protein
LILERFTGRQLDEIVDEPEHQLGIVGQRRGALSITVAISAVAVSVSISVAIAIAIAAVSITIPVTRFRRARVVAITGRAARASERHEAEQEHG